MGIELALLCSPVLNPLIELHQTWRKQSFFFIDLFLNHHLKIYFLSFRDREAGWGEGEREKKHRCERETLIGHLLYEP